LIKKKRSNDDFGKPAFMVLVGRTRNCEINV